MLLDALSAAVSGVRAAGARLRSSAHNVANLLTEDFHPERVVQAAEAQGGVNTRVERSPAPAEVDLAAELVEQQRAALAGKASLRVIDVQLDLLGRVIDLHG
jgi:flagellar basal body rod protein FlgG